MVKRCRLNVNRNKYCRFDFVVIWATFVSVCWWRPASPARWTTEYSNLESMHSNEPNDKKAPSLPLLHTHSYVQSNVCIYICCCYLRYMHLITTTIALRRPILFASDIQVNLELWWSDRCQLCLMMRLSWHSIRKWFSLMPSNVHRRLLRLRLFGLHCIQITKVRTSLRSRILFKVTRKISKSPFYHNHFNIVVFI